MVVQVIGAGLPRTGTMSLKVAAERLTGGRCYHMHETFLHPEHPALWCRVLEGETEVLDEILEGYECAVDWPMAAVWREAFDRYPDAKVLLSQRSNAATWWRSADRTVWAVLRDRRAKASDEWWRMHELLQERFAEQWDDAETAMAAYDQHVTAVRESVPSSRLVEYVPGDGWKPLCRALGVDVPEEPFPHLNSSKEFIERLERSDS